MNKQEAIEEIKSMDTVSIYNTTVNQRLDMVIKNQALDVISQIDEPQEVVIPQFVADWIDWCKRCHWDLQKTLSRLDDNRKVGDWARLDDDKEVGAYKENDELVSEKVELFARAWLAYPNITVEKEKLYKVKIADAFLTKITRGRERNVKYRMLPYKDVYNVFNDGIYNIFLTETEIKQADERLWQFAKPLGDE
jgi:hypothetical protein